MRLEYLKESAPRKRGKTTAKDVRIWLEKIHNGEATKNDIQLYNDLKAISRKLGGKTTVIEILKAI
ncbi:MAG TPA: hypothetical protein EYG89_00990 [Bacteroidia bacterium]|nr:hypothetical protein [Bacteroidia bacterium]